MSRYAGPVIYTTIDKMEPAPTRKTCLYHSYDWANMYNYIVVPSKIMARSKKDKKIPEWILKVAKEKMELAKELGIDPDTIFLYDVSQGFM
jgi:hypothetical protein